MAKHKPSSKHSSKGKHKEGSYANLAGTPMDAANFPGTQMPAPSGGSYNGGMAPGLSPLAAQMGLPMGAPM